MKTFSFFIIWLIVFAASYGLLSVAGLMPIEIKEINATVLASFSKTENTAGPLPTVIPMDTGTGPQPIRLIIKKIGVDAPVVNPQSRDIVVLDNALLKGVVHYPGSGSLESNANILVFGHSTNWTTVHNQAFKSLNRLNELQLGDEIKLFSNEKEYTYKVTKIELVDAGETLVKFEVGKRKLTLSTCDSFGKKTDRFVVEAIYKESKNLGP